MTPQHILAQAAAPADSVRRASPNLRDGRASLFAALVCVVVGVAFLAGQLGWWTLLAGPAYLAGAALAAMLAHGRAQALLSVALATASTGIVVALIKLTGLA